MFCSGDKLERRIQYILFGRETREKKLIHFVYEINYRVEFNIFCSGDKLEKKTSIHFVQEIN